jgi:GH15 family glucan-1,4-alpha-glucosidase
VGAPIRIDGYAPIGDYAVIGNKRTAALVARDGSIDWLCLPSLAGPSVFGALLDSERGGSFALAPTHPFTATRCYVEDTNVLQTTFVTAEGSVRVTDAMSRPLARGLLFNQVTRRIDGLSGRVPMCWNVAPRLDYGSTRVAPRTLGGLPVLVHGHDLVAVEAHGAGEPTADGDDVGGSFVAQAGDVAVLALSAFHREPLRISSPEHLLGALKATSERWRHWIASCDYDGRALGPRRPRSPAVSEELGEGSRGGRPGFSSRRAATTPSASSTATRRHPTRSTRPPPWRRSSRPSNLFINA